MDLKLLLSECKFYASRSSGPGGQHVNKTESRIEIHWNIIDSRALTINEKALLQWKYKKRITQAGNIIVTCQQHRSQLKNRSIAEQRLIKLVTEGLKKKKKRISTKPSKSSVEIRIKNKKYRSEIKQNRKFNRNDL